MALDLSKEVGPLPLGAWIAVVAGGLGIALWSRNQGDTGVEIAEDTGSQEGVGTGEVGGWTETEPKPDTGPLTISNNDEWGNQAIAWLIAQGYDPAWSYSAITKALNGGRGENKLSVREYSLWKLALRKFGPPPYPVTVPPPGPLPPPNPPMVKRHEYKPRTAQRPGPGPGGDPRKPAPCRICGHGPNYWLHRKPGSGKGSGNGQPNRFRYHIVKPAPASGSTLKSIAKIYYKDESKWHRIYEANRKGKRRADGTPGLIENPNKLRVGWKLIIPR